MQDKILKLSEHPELFERAADWFSDKWRVPKQAYLDSMQESLAATGGVPEWYVILEGETVVAGLGVIANDFHKRPDLTPNICAVYVTEKYRGQGIARRLLDRACAELAKHGIANAYLITDHTAFYERCGWRFFSMIEENDGGFARMYTRPTVAPEE